MTATDGRTTLAERTYLGFIWQAIGLSANTVLSLAHLIIMARLLTPEIFGQFAVVAVLIAILTIITEFGLGAALVQKDRLTESDRRFVFLTNVSIALVLLLLSSQYSMLADYFVLPVDPLIVQVLGFNVLVVSLGMASKATLQREMQFNRIVFGTTISYLCGTLIAGILMAWSGLGIWSLVLGLLINNAVLSVYFLYHAPIVLLPSGATSGAMVMLRYGSGLCLVQGINQLSRMSDKLVLAGLSTHAFVGLYERSQQIQQMPGVFLGGVFDNVLFPALSRLSTDRNALGGHFFQFCTPASMVSAYIAVTLFTFSGEFISILLGEKWMEAVSILELLALLTFFQLLSRLSDTYVRASGIFMQSVKVKIVFLILVVLAAVGGFHTAGGFGAIVGIIGASVLHTVMMLIVCARHAGYSYIELLKRLQPGLVLATLLLTKNLYLESLGFDSRLTFFFVVLLSDVVLCLLLYASGFMLGGDNKIYLDRRIKEFVSLVGRKTGFR